MPVAKFKFTIGEGAREMRSLNLEVAADEWSWDEFEVATGVSDSSILPSNITTIDVLYIESDQAVSYEHNGADTTITLDADKAHCLFGTSVTALTITNASGSTANIKLGVFGT
jgi:hypothetical protein